MGSDRPGTINAVSGSGLEVADGTSGEGVSAAVGRVPGATPGLLAGVGAAVGAAVAVGAGVGLAVGAAVGSGLGVGMGAGVGFGVGFAVGVGAGVGFGVAVGAGVGGGEIVIAGPAIWSLKRSRSCASNRTVQVPTESVVVKLYRTPFFQLSEADVGCIACATDPITTRT